VSDYVSKAVKIIKESGLTSNSEPMGTAIEGELGRGDGVVSRCFEALKNRLPQDLHDDQGGLPGGRVRPHGRKDEDRGEEVLEEMKDLPMTRGR